MRSWMLQIAYTIVLIILTLVESDDRPKRGNDNTDAFEYNEPIGTYEESRHISNGFNCATMPFPGIYADVNAGCRSFHICGTDSSGPGSTVYCPKGTMFNQQHFVCDWWYNVNCDASPQYYDLNAKLQGKRSHQYGGTVQDSGQDIFQALVTAKESASIAAEHASRAADAASAAKSAAQAKQISSQQQIHAIKASAQAQLNTARRAAQLATSNAHSRAAAAQRSAAAFEAEAYSRANAAINDASALKVEANVQYAIAKAASDAQKKAQVAKLHLDIQEEARNKALNNQERATHAHSNINVGQLVENAAKDANGQARVANLHLAIQDEAREKYFDHHARASDAQKHLGHLGQNGHVAAKVNGVIENSAANADGQARAANLHLAIQEDFRRKYYGHHASASVTPKEINGHLASTVNGVIANAAKEADGKTKVSNLHLAIQEGARQKYYDHQGSASNFKDQSRASTHLAGESVAPGEANIKTKVANLQLEIQVKARQKPLDHNDRAAQTKVTSAVVTNASAEAIGKENMARQRLTIEDKVRQYSFAQHARRVDGHQRHHATSATKKDEDTTAVSKIKRVNRHPEKITTSMNREAAHHKRHVSGYLEAAVTGVIDEAAGEASGVAKVANLQLEIQEKSRQNPFDHHEDEAQNTYDSGAGTAVISDIVSNAAADASGKEEAARQQLEIQDKVRQSAFANYNQQYNGPLINPHAQSALTISSIVANAATEASGKEEAARQQLVLQEKVRQHTFDHHDQKPEGHRRHYVRAAVMEETDAFKVFKEQEEAKLKQDNSGITENHTSKHDNNQAEDSTAKIPRSSKKQINETIPSPQLHNRERRGYDSGYIDIEQIIQNAASDASLQADTARLYVSIRAKARQQYYNQHQNRGHRRRHAAATSRSDAKARLVEKDNKKQSAMHYSDEKEADASKVTTNPTSEADRKANPINPKSHQRKARGVHPSHRSNIWQIIDNAAAEANGQAKVARLHLEIQEKARQSYYQQHERATQQAHYGHR